MSKRAVNIATLLFANIILLANTVVPHHHHENTGMCFFYHCRDSQEAHSHENNDSSKDHQHDGNPFSDKCNVDDNYVPANNNKKVADCLPVVKCDYEQAIAYCCRVNDIAVSFSHKPYLPLFYSEFVSRSIGLRAPPF